MAAGKDLKLQERLASEAPKQWAQLHGAYQRVEGAGEAFVSEEPSPVDTENWKIKYRAKFKINGDFVRLTEMRFDEQGRLERDVTFIANPKYSSLLQQKNETDGWLLTTLELVRKPEDLHAAATYASSNPVVALAALPYAIESVTLAELMRDPGFEVKDVRPVEHRNKKCVAMTFTYKAKGTTGIGDRSKPRLLMVMVGGRFVLDPARAWSIQTSEIEFIEGVSAKFSVEYGSDEQGVPVVKSAVSELLNPNNPPKSRRHAMKVRLEHVTFRDCPTVDFTLTAFGLPEPEGIVWPSPSPWWLWLSFASIGSVAMAFLFVKLIQRYQRRDSV